MVTEQDYWDEANNTIDQLRKELVKSNLEIVKLRELLETMTITVQERNNSI